VKLEVRSETSASHKYGDGTLMRGIRNSMQTTHRYQSLRKRSVLENAQRKMMDSVFSTVKWRATETGINRRKALKSCSSECGVKAKDMSEAYRFQKVRSSNHGAKGSSTTWLGRLPPPQRPPGAE
jgi:hypothetical protein